MKFLKFPKGFRWGTATASYQIEGASREDGRGLSIWDTFCRKPGRILDGSNGDVACDHYHRYRTDVALMKKLGFTNYRFSVAWPRVFPDGSGRLNKKGLDFYDRLTDTLLSAGIEPFITLYHWDLPDALEKSGGWYNRETASRFSEFAGVVAGRLADRVRYWITLNEPVVSFMNGYRTGDHAPGYRHMFRSFGVPHNLLLAHGLGLQAVRAAGKSAAGKKPQVGITNALSMFYPLRPADTKAAARAQDMMRLFLDPVFRAEYPISLDGWIRLFTAGMKQEDMRVISQPVDFLGINNYSRFVMKRTIHPVLPGRMVKPRSKGIEYTDMDWEVYPEGLYDLLKWVAKEYGNPAVYITENGAAFPDTLEKGRAVHDERRTAFLTEYLRGVHRAVSEGVNVKGYFVWSFMDNFEWAKGYAKRFGIVYVDYPTQKRVVKDSGLWYSRVCRENGFTA